MKTYLLLLLVSQGLCTQLKSCNETVSFLQLCILTETYQTGYSDYFETGSPMVIQTIVSLFQLADFDDVANTVTVNMIMGAHWNDSRLSIKQKDAESIPTWYQLNKDDIGQIHNPQLRFDDQKETKRLGNWGPEDSDYFWFRYPHNVQYHQAVQVKIVCSFKFSSYPFDNHQCDIKIGSAKSSSNLSFLPRTIVLDDNDVAVGALQVLQVNQSNIPFEIHLESLEPFNISNIGFPYPFSGIRIHLRRNSLGLLLGGFFAPTGLFALLSLASYTINPDVVPGRLGVLVTLYLIASNVYGSVKGPPSRGFSYIEIWMIGVQIPILTAIIEYAVILSMKKYQTKHKNDSFGNHQMEMVDKLAIEMDKWAFLASLLFMILFGSIFTIIAITA